MAYELQAVIAQQSHLPENWEGLSVHTIILEQGFVLIPLTDKLFDELVTKDSDEQLVLDFLKLTSEVQIWLSKLSKGGKVAYLEADYFGGTGSQSACVYENGKVTLEPFSTNNENPESSLPLGQHAINIALRHVGVLTVSGHDEFDSIGLGKCRFTNNWLKIRQAW
jgi:hypothetical protein